MFCQDTLSTAVTCNDFLPYRITGSSPKSRKDAVKGVGRGRLGSSWKLKFLAEKGCFLSFEW